MKLITTIICICSISLYATLYADWDAIENDTTIAINPKPESLTHLMILPPSMQQEMTATAKPMVGHSGRSSSKGGQNLSRKPRGKGEDTSKLSRKKRAEKDNGATGF